MQTERVGNRTQAVWMIDPDHSTVEFSVVKLFLFNVKGRFREIAGRSADFLAADRYPDITFQSTSVARGVDRDTLRITGSLMIRDAIKEVVLNVHDIDRSRSPNGEDFIYYSATTAVDRFAFGIKHSRGLVGAKVKIAINVQGCR